MCTSKHTGAMLSYMKVMHYGLMFPKACYGDAALIWNALCGKWIYRSREKKLAWVQTIIWILTSQALQSLKECGYLGHVQYVRDVCHIKTFVCKSNVQDTCKNRINNHCDKKKGFTFSIIIAMGVTPEYIALLRLSPAGSETPFSSFPHGQVIILIYLLPVHQLLFSDHLCAFIISAGAL